MAAAAARQRKMGGAKAFTPKDLELFENDDPHAVLLKVPGIYLRQEDGYGLRPNIGLRGASSDRSKKVTLMEDGILFVHLGPATDPQRFSVVMQVKIPGMD